MSVNNVTISGSSLISSNNSGVAVSEIITQDTADTDFESVRETRGTWLLNNICDSVNSSADTAAIIGGVINNGDRIFIVKDNVPYETVVTGIQTIYGSGLIPLMTSDTSPSGVATNSTNNSSFPAYYAFDGNGSTNTYLTVGNFLQYEFDVPTLVSSIYLDVSANFDAFTGGVSLSGSQDGVNFVTLIEKISGGPYNTAKKWSVNVPIPGKFKFYRLTKSSPNYEVYFNSVQLFSDIGYTIDTSAITNGATPTNVYRFEEKVIFNSTLCVERDKYLEFGTHGSQLYVQNIYNDALISGRTLQTTIEFSATGNELIELTGQVYKQP